MFVFIVPLRSPQTSNNWKTVSQLCNETLNSILQQTSPNFKIILVCNEPPLYFNYHQKILLVQEDFPTPTSWNEGIKDIYLKVKRGMIEAKQFAPRFVMRVDADDLVSNRLVEFTESHYDSDGWYFLMGYIYEIGKDHLFLRPRFTTLSGSSNILRCQKEDFPDSMTTPPDKWLEPVFQHLNINKFLKSRGRKLKPLPFTGAVYRIIAVENMSGTSLENERFSNLKSFIWKKIFYRKLTPKIMIKFGFPNHELSKNKILKGIF